MEKLVVISGIPCTSEKLGNPDFGWGREFPAAKLQIDSVITTVVGKSVKAHSDEFDVNIPFGSVAALKTVTPKAIFEKDGKWGFSPDYYIRGTKKGLSALSESEHKAEKELSAVMV